eukprot:gnl/TRDRNA2_/TRDRNA2_174203_c7_seq1.p1 gnl/TRDRNA2_/TRDRNA2_174203_c7~~gnl/TRDRNA2_/TRDRNA2_174203_c7_seq1.p1  ORF type:complete len:408 (-),score=47.44 gnl/TRDRNA2_/TRDRNA2_174203_c7_seq1:57-1199(-)
MALQAEDGMVSEEPNWLTALRTAKGGDDSLYRDARGVYCLSLYWAVVTLTSIGYGDITPQNEWEYWISTACMTIMATIWAYVIGAVCGIVSTLDPHTVRFKQTMDDLNDLMENRNVPQHMRRDLRTYFHESRTMRRRMEEAAIMDQVSPMLQGEAAMWMYQSWLQNVDYLQNVDSDVIVSLALHLGTMVFAPQEQIPILRTLFIVQRGVAAKNGRVLTLGATWGEDMILNDESLLDRNWARSLGYLEVLTLSRQGLDTCTEKFPHFASRIRWSVIRLTFMRKLVRMSKQLAAVPGFDKMNHEERMAAIARVSTVEEDAEVQARLMAQTKPEPTNRQLSDQLAQVMAYVKLLAEKEGVTMEGIRSASLSNKGSMRVISKDY